VSTRTLDGKEEEFSLIHPYQILANKGWKTDLTCSKHLTAAGKMAYITMMKSES